MKRFLLGTTALFAMAGSAWAQDATWLAAPISNVYNTAANWTPAGVPTGVATFGASTQTNVTINVDSDVGSFVFVAGAPAYTFILPSNRDISFMGAGIVNNSAFRPTFDGPMNGLVRFFNASTAGNANITTDFGFFGGTSNAGTANLTLVAGSLASGWTFDNNSSAANATIVNNTQLIFKAAASAGQANITTIAGSMIEFRNTSTAANATIVNNGSIIFFDTSTSGNATITTNSGGSTDFFGTNPGGNARLISNADGTTGFYNKAGATAGSIEGAGTFDLSYYGLTVGSNNLSTEVTGKIIDAGDPLFKSSLTKIGAGTLTLSGINTYIGTTTINAGTLSVNGSIASSDVTVNAGGTLGGNGIVGNTTINGGALAPGNSIGLLTVQGNLVFTAASSYMVEVSPANADRTNVSGTATLGGAAVNASFAAGSYVTKQYTIVNATGGVIGTFGSAVNTNLPANFTSNLSYDSNNAYLNLALNFVQPPVPNFGGGLNQNQQNVANTLVNFFNSNGGIPLAFGALTPVGLTQVSGETAVGAQQATFDAMGQFIGLMSDPFAAGRGETAAPVGDAAIGYAASDRPSDAMAAIYRKAPPAIDAFARRWSIWGAGFGGSQTTDGNATLGSNTATSRIYGTAVGLDYRLSPYTLAGIAVAGGGTNFSVANGGTGRSDFFQAGAFVRHAVGPSYLSAALAYGRQDITTDRTVAGVDRINARFDANALSGRIEGGYRWGTQAAAITPYAAGQVTTLFLPAYAETGAAGGLFGLNYAAKDVTASRSELGLRADQSFGMVDGVLTLRGRAAWAHNFNPDRSINATFQTLPGASFVVNGAAQAREAALVTASAEMKWRNGWAIATTFEGEFSDVTRSYAGKGVVKYAW